MLFMQELKHLDLDFKTLQEEFPVLDFDLFFALLFKITAFDKLTLCLYNNTVKPVLRGHLQDKRKWPYKTGDLLKEVQFK